MLKCLLYGDKWLGCKDTVSTRILPALEEFVDRQMGGDSITMLTHLKIKLQLYVVSCVKERYTRIYHTEGLT